MAAPQHGNIWNGLLEWKSNGKNPGDQMVIKHLMSQVYPITNEPGSELVSRWPQKLELQLKPLHIIRGLAALYLKAHRKVQFSLQVDETLDLLTRYLLHGYAGFIDVSPCSCHVRVAVLLYVSDRRLYMGFVPNDQANFIDQINKEILHSNVTLITSKQTFASVTTVATDKTCIAPTAGALDIVTNNAQPIHADVKPEKITVDDKVTPPKSDSVYQKSLRKSLQPATTKLDLVRCINRIIVVIVVTVSFGIEFYPTIAHLFSTVFNFMT